MTRKILILLIIGAIGILFNYVLRDIRSTQEVPPPHSARVAAATLEYWDYRWLDHKLSRRQVVSARTLETRFGRPTATQDHAMGSEQCWYYPCTKEDGATGKLQIVISDSIAKRARLY